MHRLLHISTIQNVQFQRPLIGRRGQVLTSDSEQKNIAGVEGDDGFWRDENGECLHVSASDLERHSYCPLSWKLSRMGKSGRGEAVQAGIEKHAEIHSKIQNYKKKQIDLRRALIIWSWWYTIIFIFVGDAIVFGTIINEIVEPEDVAKYLAILALIWLIAGSLAIYLPWRQMLKMPSEATKQLEEIRNLEDVAIISALQPPGFIGGWSQGGKIEAGLLMGSIFFGLHAIGLVWVKNTQQAGFILVIIAMIWTLMASWQLQKALLANNALEIARVEAGVEQNTDVTYSDDDTTAGLLFDNESGLRGRPDQITIVDGEFIPVEQKTGKVPKKPHKSHEIQLLAYLHLVDSTTGRKPPYGVLRYGSESLHALEWNDEAKHRLFSATKEIQRLMVQGGAERNHNRPGKCESCSRRYACDSSLV